MAAVVSGVDRKLAFPVAVLRTVLVSVIMDVLCKCIQRLPAARFRFRSLRESIRPKLAR